MATPTNANGIAKLLGHAVWYIELIPDFSRIAVPITQLRKKNIRFVWTDACQKAFEKLRSKLSTYSVLRPPDWEKSFHVFCDVRNLAVGSALFQSTGKKEND